MSYEWSLDVFYKGIDDPNLAADMAKLEEKTAGVISLPAAVIIYYILIGGLPWLLTVLAQRCLKKW